MSRVLWSLYCASCDREIPSVWVQDGQLPPCEECGGATEKNYSGWRGATDGVSSGIFVMGSTKEQWRNRKRMVDHYLRRRRRKPGEFIGYGRDGKRQYAAELMHPSAEKQHGARTEHRVKGTITVDLGRGAGRA